MITALAALQRLKDGNSRFASGRAAMDARPARRRPTDLVSGQAPFAIVLGCSDSRVPAEIVFDQDLGDLFVIRVAGNIVAPSQVGSVEFAASRFGTRLVVVLGHTRCGAIDATLESLRDGSPHPSRNIGSIVDRIRPALEPLVLDGSALDESDLARRAVRANVRASVAQLAHGSEILEDLLQHEGLVIAGAEYALETGVVEFFEA